jgi:glycosyltransferase involved in cell wall biosynthesis
MASVLHVVSYYPPDRLGGVGEVVASVHRGLLALGHRSQVVTSGSSHDDPLVMRVSRGPGGFPLASARALDAARAADIVHLHHAEGIGLLLAMRLARVETPALLTLHVGVARMAESLGPYRVAGLSLGRESTRAQLHRRLVMPLRAAMDRAGRALANDLSFIARSAARDNLEAAEADRARLIYNGVEPNSNAVEPAPPCDLLFVGADSTRKRVELLPLILRAVRRRHPVATMRIVGLDRDTNPAVFALAKRIGVADALQFAGPLRGDALTAQYRAAKVLVVPSAYEGLPMVILEAFAQGLPCVATKVSGHPEVITDGKDGFLVPLDDVEMIAERASRVIADAALRERIAAQARNTISGHFTLERQLREYLTWYAPYVGAA